MPAWPRPNDIWFDHAAADEVIDAIAATRFGLESGWVIEEAAADGALDAWDGMAARAFRSSLGARANLTVDLAGELRLLQTSIELAIDDASIHQRRIEDLQSTWDAQNRAELVAADDVAEQAAQAASGFGVRRRIVMAGPMPEDDEQCDAARKLRKQNIRSHRLSG